jgi:F-type H+-transporting ATPase subunit epsilon
VARTTFPVEVLTPEGEVFNDEVEMVSTRTGVGSIGILANHQPLLAMLEPTELRLYKSESDVVRYAQGEGYVQVAGNRVLVLVEEAEDPGSLDASLLRDRLQTAEREADQAAEDSEEKRRADRDRRRWEAFLRIAEGE